VNEPKKQKPIDFRRDIYRNGQNSESDEEGRQAALAEIYYKIVETKQDMFPTFSGYLGETYRKAGNVNILELFKPKLKKAESKDTIQIEEN